MQRRGRVSVALVVLALIAAFTTVVSADQPSRMQARLERCREAALKSEDSSAAERCALRISKKLSKLGVAQIPVISSRVALRLAELTGAVGVQTSELSTPVITSAASTPSQSQMNKVVKAFLKSNLAGEECVASCAAMMEGAEPGTNKCKSGGSVKISVIRCNSKGKVRFPLNFKQCRSGKTYYNGQSELGFTVKPGSIKTKLVGNNITLEGVTLTTRGVTVSNTCNGGTYGPSSCKGTISAGRKSCRMSSDCQRCQF